MSVDLQEALGPPGKPGDDAALVFNARKVAAVYRHAIEWSQRIRRAHLPECFRPVATEMALFTGDIIEKIEAYGPRLLSQIEEALSAERAESPRIVEAILTLDFRNLERFQAALAQAERDCFGA